jgi:hypothetical protein
MLRRNHPPARTEDGMNHDYQYGHDELPSWRDIEALPLYLAVALTAVALLYVLVDGTPTLHWIAVKALPILAALGLSRIPTDIVLP